MVDKNGPRMALSLVQKKILVVGGATVISTIGVLVCLHFWSDRTDNEKRRSDHLYIDVHHHFRPLPPASSRILPSKNRASKRGFKNFPS
ncbi:hypothetical protein PMAYCL1PPCAC_12150 [Pristionchus mayeri]|uniref:Uncharacterized protein n=1 Tax=Pristionchus mayeri TaxID=1317129 RepID=A0AAN4ZRQ1_9BILA|nr:hypothetical protein PMAYCL1PPCAC_12150 [Pristionchus mayeri]